MDALTAHTGTKKADNLTPTVRRSALKQRSRVKLAHAFANRTTMEMICVVPQLLFPSAKCVKELFHVDCVQIVRFCSPFLP